MGGYLSSSCCAVSSAPVFCLLRYEGFLKDIGAEVEVNPDDQYQFLSVYTRHNALFSVAWLSRYFPESVSYRAMGRSILSLHYILLLQPILIPLKYHKKLMKWVGQILLKTAKSDLYWMPTRIFKYIHEREIEDFEWKDIPSRCTYFFCLFVFNFSGCSHSFSRCSE